MRRFRYHLQKIVDLKSNEKAQAEWILTNALAKLKMEEQSLEQLHATRRSIEELLQESASVKISVAELGVLQDYLQYIDTLIKQKQKSLLQAKQDVADKSEQLVSKMKDEKIWLKARERSFAAFKAEYLRREQLELDEMAAVRFGKT